MKDPNRRSPLDARPVSLVVGGLLVLLGYLMGSSTSSSGRPPAAAGRALLDEVPRLRQELASLRSSLGAAASPCPICSCPAPVACTHQQQQQQQQQRGCDLHGKYNLSHLDQPPDQDVVGPVQDDEALFLYSIVRGLRLSRVLEIGGLSGYSARNFLQAMEPTQGVVYTVDIRKVPPVDSERHICIQKDAALLDAADVDNQPLDLVFFDAHALDPQWNLYQALLKAGAITNYTLLVFHDTNTHPHKVVRWSFQNAEGGWVHHTVEGKMVNKFHEMGWDAFMLHPRKEVHSKEFPYRHGVVVMQKFERLNVKRKRLAPSPAPP